MGPTWCLSVRLSSPCYAAHTAGGAPLLAYHPAFSWPAAAAAAGADGGAAAAPGQGWGSPPCAAAAPDAAAAVVSAGSPPAAAGIPVMKNSEVQLAATAITGSNASIMHTNETIQSFYKGLVRK